MVLSAVLATRAVPTKAVGGKGGAGQRYCLLSSDLESAASFYPLV